jgi:hypothetical protein
MHKYLSHNKESWGFNMSVSLALTAVPSAVEIVIKLVAGYTGYSIDKKNAKKRSSKEKKNRDDLLNKDDLLVRKKLESEILKSLEHGRNIQELLYEKKNMAGIRGLRKVQDELDVFSNELSLSIVTHQYPFFSTQADRSPNKEYFDKLIQFDADMLTSLIDVTTALHRIETHVIDDTNINYENEFIKLRQYLTVSRNKYRDRENFLKEWK